MHHSLEISQLVNIFLNFSHVLDDLVLHIFLITGF